VPRLTGLEGSTRPRRLRSVWPGGTSLAVVIVTLLAAADLASGPDVLLGGVMTVGPCLAAVSGSPRAVAAVTAYSTLLLLVVSSIESLWWTRQQTFWLLALLSVATVSAFVARRRQQSEELLREAQAAGARSLAVSEATGAFLSRVSHELRTPLNAILGFNELLQRDDLTPDQEESAQQVARAGKHLLALVNDVLELTASDARRLSLSIEQVSVGDVVREAVELTSPEAVAAQVDLDVQLGDVSGWYVVADARRTRQILLNLLSNAVKFNHAGGQVKVRALRNDDGGISIAVSDTGPGIARADLPKLFQPFERLDAARAGIEGSGLGLALSRGLAEAMDGSLTVVSSPRAGATFTVTLPETAAPVAEVPDSDGQSVAASPAAPEREARVLYIEDNLSNMRLVKRILEFRPAWTMTHAPAGVEGLDIARASRFDLILLDHDLPDLNGFEVLRRLRKHESQPATPVVIVSAHASAAQIDEARAAGANDYLVKPFTIDGLLAVIDEHYPSTGSPGLE
jgi:signal transduction histidine kinase/CheY-like chemotaxis protein